MEHTKGYERTKAYQAPKKSDPNLNQTWLQSPSPRDPGQSPSPQGPKIAKERWGAVNELDSHTVRLRCIQYSMRQYMVGPEFLTQATPERLGERIEQAAIETFPMDQGEEQVEPVRHQGTKTAAPGGAVEIDAPTQFNNSMRPKQIDKAKQTQRNVKLHEGVVVSLWHEQGIGVRRTSRKRIGIYGEGWLDQEKGHRAGTQLKMSVMRRRLPEGVSRRSAAIKGIVSRGKSKDICKRPRGNKGSRRIGCIEKSKAVEGKERKADLSQAAITQRKGAGPITCQKYKAGWRRARGLGRNHEVQGAGT
ncbi:hypothetical protein GGX14DRAFT_404885 [Mycena pura]|uniref:Uncharacterized protein n=1 Tax=Mycena pura TaxID=153505 RepID=A0AAD6UTE4_9AGAR|nr:hypothetical protein GGX14DRAFT_404885 [Mycena pura]